MENLKGVRQKKLFRSLKCASGTSSIVRRRLEKQGVHKDSPVDALLKTQAKEYSHVLIIEHNTQY